MRIALLDTYYPRFLAAHYAAHPTLEGGAYEYQRQNLLGKAKEHSCRERTQSITIPLHPTLSPTQKDQK